MALVARRLDRLEALAAEISQNGRRAVVITADVTRDGDLERAAREARAALGRLDVVVANAGLTTTAASSKPTSSVSSERSTQRSTNSRRPAAGSS